MKMLFKTQSNTSKKTSQNHHRKQISFITFGAASVAAAIAETCTFPLDLTKTRLQIQGEIVGLKGKRKGMFKTAWSVVHNEGLLKLWRGLKPAVLRHIFYTGCRLSTYVFARDKILRRNENGYFPLHKAVMCGIFSGAFAQFITSPTDLVKVQMQMEGKRMLQGLKPRYTGTFNAFATIIRRDGFFGLWRGVAPNCQRAGLVALGDLTAYDTVKHLLLRNTQIGDNSLTHIISSASAGLCSAIAGTPADVIKTRMMNQPVKEGRGLYYRSSIDCLIKTIRNERFYSLYKGFIPIWMRMAPWSITFWLVHEQLRKLVGLSSF